MQTLARTSAAALLFACALVASAANPGTLPVLNTSDNTVSLVDLASKKSIATIPTGSGSHEVAVSAEGRTAVVCNYGSQLSPGSTLTVIDILARKSIANDRSSTVPQTARHRLVAR